MKKKFSKMTYLISSLILTLSLFNCDLSNNDSKTGSLNLSITEEVSRTIIPELSMEPESYEIIGIGPDSTTFTETSTDASITVDNLAFGDWSITVTAFNEDETIIGSGTGNVSVHSNETSILEIVVTPIAGIGSLDLTLNWTESDVDSPEVIASLLPTVGDSIELEFTVNSGTATYSGTDIDSGYYTLTLQLLDNGILTLGTVEVVRVVSDQTTTGVFTFDDIKEATGTITTNIDVQMANPLLVSIAGSNETKPQNEIITLTASVADYTDNITYVWYIDAASIGTGDTFNFDDTLALGPYNVSVTAFSIDGSRAGSETISIEVIEPNIVVSFDSNSGSSVDSQYVAEGDKATKPTAPTKTGYTFINWYAESDLTTLWDFDIDTINSNISLYAKWEINSYTVTFDSNLGTSITNQVINYGGELTKPMVSTRTGYIFVDWCSDSDLTTPWDFGNDTINSNISLYAIWQISTYTVTFNSSSGSSVSNQQIDYGAEVTQPTDPTRTGYIFVNWYSDSSLSSLWDFENDVITSNTNLYVKWFEYPEYIVGDIGPTGGYIFYAKSSYTNGWRYLEAAPADLPERINWGTMDHIVPGADSTAIGSGAQNTLDIVAGDSLTENAARACLEYSLENDGITYSDWFLPSKKELDAMHANLRVKGLGAFFGHYYLSSSEYSDDSVWATDRGAPWNNFGKYKRSDIRPARAF